MATGFKSNTGIAALDRLVSIGGMSSMLDTIWLIMAAMAFGAVLDHSGMLAVLNAALLRAATTTGRLIAAVAFTAFGMNIITGDQYLAILIPGKMYAREFKERELDATDLSRALDNGGTTTSVLVPWNSCGAFHAAALGVPVLAYAPFAIFTYLTPLVLVVLGFTGIGIRKARTVTSARLSQKS
jgi:NhaC family Na+:H+ antiporter